MSISYAQNFEDVMLRRALRDCPVGFYIDVGAHDPDEFSVTKFFYELGWRGINIEPVSQYYDALMRARPEDTNLNVAAGSAPGSLPMFVVPDTGLSTFVEEHADHAASRGFSVSRTLVPIVTLDDICKQFPVPIVHFLKIDVEGAEADVLRGMSFKDVRPWIVLVEATRPGTQELAFDDWEPLLLAHGYEFVYFDGLNRFYVAVEKSTLGAAFDAPPNVFDGFITARQHALELKSFALDGQLREAQSKVETLQSELDRIDAWVAAWPDGEPADTPTTPTDDRVQRLKFCFSGLLALSQRLVADRASLDTALQAARGEVFRQKGVAEDLDQRLQKSLRDFDEILAAHAARGEENTRMSVQRAAHEAEIARLNELHTALVIAHAELQQQHAIISTRSYETAAQAQHFERETSRLQDALASLHSAIDALERDLQSARQLVESHAESRDRFEKALATSQDEARRLDLELQDARHHVAGLERRHQVMVLEMDAFRLSRSWRYTAPFRAVMRWITARQ